MRKLKVNEYYGGEDNPVFKIEIKPKSDGDQLQAKRDGGKGDPQEEWEPGHNVSGKTEDGTKVSGSVTKMDKDKDGNVLKLQVLDKDKKKHWILSDTAKHIQRTDAK